MTNVVILAAGIILIAAFRRPDFLHTLIFITGVLFIVPGLINIFSLAREKKKGPENPERKPAGALVISWITSGAAVILGISMCVIPGSYVSLLIYIFALTLIVLGGYHIYMLAKGLKPVSFPGWTYAMPVLTAAAGIAILLLQWFRTTEGHSAVVLITGIGLVLFAVTSFIEMAGIRATHKPNAPTGIARRIEDVDAHEI